MDCRGTKRRQWIVDNYIVAPVAHIQLLNGQTKHSDAGACIENDYYIFEAISKNNGEKQIIQCGKGAATDFLRLIKHKGLPLFNPIHGMDGNRQISNGVHELRTYDRKTDGTWNPVAKQLYNAIMWLIIAWDAKPDTPLFDFMNDIVKYKRCVPFGYKVKRVNTVIINGGKGKTLTEIINEFRDDNNVRDEMCKFNLLTDIIEAKTDKNGNRIRSYF